MSPTEENPPTRFGPLLRRADQGCTGTLLLISLVGLGLFWLQQQQRNGGVIEIDDQDEPLSIDFQVDINTAELPELTMLPGIGDKLAQRILDSRKTDGPFSSHDEVQRVKGIGPRTVERLRPYLLPILPAENVAAE